MEVQQLYCCRTTRTRRRCISHPPGSIFYAWYDSTLVGLVPWQKGRRWKYLAESFPKTYGSVLAPLSLSSNQARKTVPGGCDIHRHTRYWNFSYCRSRGVATPGFFCVFALIVWVGIFFFFLRKRSAISSIFASYIFSGREHALRKTAYVPVQTWKSSAVYLRRKLTFTATFLVRLTYQLDAFFNPKHASDTNSTNNTPSIWKMYEFSRHRCRLVLKVGDTANYSHSDRCQPLTIVKHEPRKLRVRGCRTTKIHAQLYGMQTQLGVLFRDAACSAKKVGVNVSFLPR